LKRKKSSTEKVEFPDSIEIDDISDSENADPSMDVTERGIRTEAIDVPVNA
jgi:hypothetical protein